ncbi:MAG: capsid cement protein, partial [Planctomycetota bacterium]
VDLESGDLFELPDGRAAMYQGLKPAVTGEDVVGQYAGIVDLKMASADTRTAGADVHYHKTEKLAKTAADGGNTFLAGKAVIAKVDGDTRVRLELNG